MGVPLSSADLSRKPGQSHVEMPQNIGIHGVSCLKQQFNASSLSPRVVFRTEKHRKSTCDCPVEKAELPRIDQITSKEKPDLATYYIVRRPQWSPVEELLTPELPVEE
jgi:hypothetical protein